MEKILRRVILEGKFYRYTCERWTAFGWRLGQVCYESRTYRDGSCRSALMCRRGVLAEFNGKEGKKMAKRDCCNCADWPTCPKPINGGDSCEQFRDKKGPDAQVWNALQEAINHRSTAKLMELAKNLMAVR